MSVRPQYGDLGLECHIKIFFLAIARGRYFHIGGFEIHKSFGYVKNTVYELDKLILASHEKVHRKTFYLADYPPINLREMANYIQKVMSAKKIKTIPLALFRMAAFFGDLFEVLGWQQSSLTSFRLQNILTQMVYNCEPLKEIVGELPFSMEKGIQETVAWLRGQGQI